MELASENCVQVPVDTVLNVFLGVELTFLLETFVDKEWRVHHMERIPSHVQLADITDPIKPVL